MMLAVSTPFDVKSLAYWHGMDDIAKLRVDRLVAALKRRKLCLDPDGEVHPKLLSDALLGAGLKGSYTYCRDVLSKQHKSFAGAKAREIEGALGLPPLLLDGASDWPFRVLTSEGWQRLDESLRIEVEQRLLGALQMQSGGSPPSPPEPIRKRA